MKNEPNPEPSPYWGGNKIKGNPPMLSPSLASNFKELVEDLSEKAKKLPIARSTYNNADSQKQSEYKTTLMPYIIAATGGSSVPVPRKGCSGNANLLFIDVDDHISVCRVLEQLEQFPFDAAWYDSVSSQPGALRLRVVISAEGIAKEKYMAAVATVAKLLGLDSTDYDKASVVFNQPMICPVYFHGESPVKVNSVLNESAFTLEDIDSSSQTNNGSTGSTNHNNPDNLHQLERPKEDFPVEEVRKALKDVSPDLGEPEWIKVLFAIKHQLQDEHDQGRGVALEWSEGSERMGSEEQFEKHWESFDPYSQNGQSVTFSTVVRMAQENGYKCPKPGAEAMQRLDDRKEAGNTKLPKKEFKLKHISEIFVSKEATDFIKGVLFQGTLSMIYALPSGLKSFFVLDMAVCVATGREWRGRKVKQGGVLYICLEGVRGFENRVSAYIKEGLLPKGAPFYLLESSLNLMKGEDMEALIAAIFEQMKVSDINIRWVIIDTLSRSIAGARENSAEDMSVAIENAGRIQHEVGSAVTIVHHSGKVVGNGARGSSAILGAVDTQIYLEKSEKDGRTISTAKVNKQKDAVDGQQFAFGLKEVELGTDSDGDPITSCVVEHLGDECIPAKSKKGRPKKWNEPNILLAALPAKSVKEWGEQAIQQHGMSLSAFKNLKKELPDHSYIFAQDGSISVVTSGKMKLLPDVPSDGVEMLG